MIRHLRSTVATLALLPLTATLVACVDDESSLYVRQVQVLTDSCVAEADPGAEFRTAGTLDTAFAGEYGAFLLVGNQVVQRGDANRLRTETSKIQLYEYDVHVIDANGGEVNAYTAPTSGFVDERKGQTPGYGLVGAILVDSESATKLKPAVNQRNDVVASVIVRGRTLGGNTIESAEFNFPISICNQCLLNFPASAVSEDTCQLCGSTEEDAEINCTPGQDQFVDCRTCAGANPGLCNPVNPHPDPALCIP